MSGPLRSKQGCWTCSLRRKKCDERHPICLLCESLTIYCHGYGPKPDWMDNGEKERAMANSIKQIVKYTSVRKGRSEVSIGRLPEQQYQGQKSNSNGFKLAPKPTSDCPGGCPSSDDSNNAGPKEIIQGDDFLTQASKPSTAPNLSADPELKGDTTLPGPLSSPAISSNDAALLMHFLDNVFPLQYPLYRPEIIDGGRGWILSLLLRTKPLYHAALALSAYHRKTSLLVASREGCRIFSSAQQEMHLSICLTDFQQAIRSVGGWVKAANPSDVLGIMASTVQLVFFELFAGHGNTWQIHLRAATDVCRESYEDREAWLIAPPYPTLDSDTTSVGHELLVPEEVVICRFLSGVVIWLDIISCTTTGKSPRLLSIHFYAISPHSPIRIEKIMGCNNWVMFQTGRIAALQDYKTQASYDNSFDAADFERRADIIRKELQNWLTEGFLASLRISNSDSPVRNPVAASPTLVTRMFALAAFIYLHVVVSGFQQQTEELDTTVWEAMALLRTQFPANLTHAIVCPLYIIGCVARSEDKDYFRNVFSTEPLLDPSLEHRGKILPLLEEIWHMRDTNPGGWTWEDSLKLSNNSLLLL